MNNHNQFNLEDALGWHAAVDLATSLGWRHGSRFLDKMKRKELNVIMNITAKLLNETRQRITDLHSVYIAAYNSSYQVTNNQLKKSSGL